MLIRKLFWIPCLTIASFALAQQAVIPAPALPDPPLVPVTWVDEAAPRATLANYPDADTVVVADNTRTVYQPDGTSVVISEEYTKALTEKGRRDSRSVSMYYTTHYGQAFILLAEIIKPDGSRVPVDIAAQSREMIDTSQMGSNIYDPNSKIIQLSLPGMEIGDLRHIVVARVTSKARVPDTWADYTIFEHTSPIQMAEYEIQAPAARPLRAIRLRDEIPGTVKYSAATNSIGILHRWSVRDVPQAFPEPNMPPLYTVVQRLLVSTTPDWRAISRWYWELSLPRLEATTEGMRDEVTRLIAGAANRDEKIRRIFNFVSQQIRYMGITAEAEAPGYEPHDVSLTFENRYGVCRDKAALLVTMFRMADITAYPVLIHAGVRKDPDVPQPFFNHAIVAAEINPEAKGAAKYLLMDPTDEKTRDLLPGFLRNKSFLVAHPEGETLLDTGPLPPEENLVRIQSKGRLDAANALTLDTTIVFEGVNDNAYRGHFARLKPEERRLFIEGLARRRLAGATLRDYSIEPADMDDTSSPVTITMSSYAPDFLVQGADASVLNLPWLGGSVGIANWVIGRTGLAKRRFPLNTEPTCGIVETLTLETGDALGKPLALPGMVERTSDGILYKREVSFSEDGTLHAESKFLVQAPEFSPEAYLGLRNDLAEIEFAGRRRAIFAKGAEDSEANIRVLAREMRVSLESPRSWSTLETTKKRVLTYAGQKANSELKISFNPAWQTVEVVEAQVTAPDGKVRKVSELETNLMDAAWVGAAPRYPASKTLVVNLPGVEVGSEIITTVRRTYKDLPFFSMQWTLQMREPMDYSALVIEHPQTMKLNILQPNPKLSVPVSYERSVDGDTARLSWTAREVPAYKTEDSLPPAWTHLPTVFASTGDWKPYAADIGKRFAQLSRGQSQARAKARELVKGVRGKSERTRIIRDFVASSITQRGPAFTRLPLETLSPADRTLQDGYGHGADTAILLMAMLDAVGVKTEPLLAASKAPYIEELAAPLVASPQRSTFDSPLVRAYLGRGESVLLNDTDQYTELGASRYDRRIFLSTDGIQGRIALSSKLVRKGEVHWELNVGADGDTRIVNEVVYHGMDAGAFHKQHAEMLPEQRRRFVEELVAGISQAARIEGEIETLYDRYPGVQRFVVNAPRYAAREGDTLTLTLPGVDGNILPLRSEKRYSPIYRASFGKTLSTYKVRFPATAKRILVAPPENLEIELPGGLGVVRSSLKSERLADGGLEVTMERIVKLDSGIAPAELYPALLEISRKLQHPAQSTIVIEMEAQ